MSFVNWCPCELAIIEIYNLICAFLMEGQGTIKVCIFISYYIIIFQWKPFWVSLINCGKTKTRFFKGLIIKILCVLYLIKIVRCRRDFLKTRLPWPSLRHHAPPWWAHVILMCPKARHGLVSVNKCTRAYASLSVKECTKAFLSAIHK